MKAPAYRILLCGFVLSTLAACQHKEEKHAARPATPPKAPSANKDTGPGCPKLEGRWELENKTFIEFSNDGGLAVKLPEYKDKITVDGQVHEVVDLVTAQLVKAEAKCESGGLKLKFETPEPDHTKVLTQEWQIQAACLQITAKQEGFPDKTYIACRTPSKKGDGYDIQ